MQKLLGHFTSIYSWFRCLGGCFGGCGQLFKFVHAWLCILKFWLDNCRAEIQFTAGVGYHCQIPKKLEWITWWTNCDLVILSSVIIVAAYGWIIIYFRDTSFDYNITTGKVEILAFVKKKKTTTMFLKLFYFFFIFFKKSISSWWKYLDRNWVTGQGWPQFVLDHLAHAPLWNDSN